MCKINDKNGCILICLSYQMSHAIPIINYIQKQNYKRIFYGDELLKDFIEKKGETFIVCNNSEIKKLLYYRKKLKIKKFQQVYKEVHQQLERIINRESIKHIFCDISRYMLYAPIAVNKGVPLTIYWTYNGPTNFNLSCPPQTSFGVIGNLKFLILLSWLKQFFKGEILSKKVFYYFFYPYNQIIKIKNLKKLRYSIDGFFLDTEKLICGEQLYNNYSASDTKYTGILLDKYSYHEKSEFINEKKINIYISFGTNNIRYKNCKKIFIYILENIKKHDKNQKVNIVLNYGNIEKEELKIFQEYSSIKIVNNINQQLLIKDVDVVIFHGGFGTMKECIYYKKRMIAIPFIYDQMSNAMLLEKKGLGICIKPRKVFKTNFYCAIMNNIENKQQ